MSVEKITLKQEMESLAGLLFLPAVNKPSPALIICHGAGEFKEDFIEMGTYLADQGIAVLVVDLYGHGESSGTRHVIDIKRWVEDIHVCCDYLSSRKEIDAEKIAGFGFSSGGTAILEAALDEKRIKTLILLDATVRNSLPIGARIGYGFVTGIGWIYRFFTHRELYLNPGSLFWSVSPAVDPEVVRKLMEHEKLEARPNLSPFPGGAASYFVDTIKRVSRITQPTLVIWGQEDQIDPLASAHLLYSKLTCKKDLQIVPGNGHLGHLDQNHETVFHLTSDWIKDNFK